MTFAVHQFSDIPNEQWLLLLNHPDVIRHMPLSTESWTEHAVMEWAKGKDAQWQAHGYGPWAIRIDGAFAGWGGFQKKGREADLALVLLPEFWGYGPALVRHCMNRRQELGIGPVSILLPPSRVRVRGLARIGFAFDCEVEYEGQRFLKFRAVE
jgi:hypothetical protein